MTPLASKSTSQIFTVPVSDWMTINKRVGVALKEEAIETYVSQSIPSYPALLSVCKAWAGPANTFACIIDLSQAVARYSGIALTDFNALNEAVKRVQGDVIPEALRQQTTDALQKLAGLTTSLATSSNALSQRISKFVAANKVTDVQLAAAGGRAGSFWAPVSSQIAVLENANGLVLGSWSAIASDLSAVQVPSTDVTMPFLVSLGIEEAIADWTSIQAEATAFAPTVSAQPDYWTNPF